MIEFWLVLFVIVTLFTLIAIYGFIVPFLVSLDSTFCVIIGLLLCLVTPFVAIRQFINFMKWVNKKAEKENSVNE